MKLSDKIVKLRKANGWSQEDFTEKLNVSRQAISRWENGTALPDAQNILQIGKLLGVTADYLLCDDREDFGENPIDQQTQQEEKNFVLKETATFGICHCFCDCGDLLADSRSNRTKRCVSGIFCCSAGALHWFSGSTARDVFTEINVCLNRL